MRKKALDAERVERVNASCDVPHRIGEKVPGAIYVETSLNPVDAF